MKMATARKPESLVWIVNEVELLLRLTIDYEESTLQERLNLLQHDHEQKREGCVFGFFHPETQFQKSVFSGSMWTIDLQKTVSV